MPVVSAHGRVYRRLSSRDGRNCHASTKVRSRRLNRSNALVSNTETIGERPQAFACSLTFGVFYQCFKIVGSHGADNVVFETASRPLEKHQAKSLEDVFLSTTGSTIGEEDVNLKAPDPYARSRG